MNRFRNTLIITFLLVLLLVGCSNGSQSEAEYFDPMNKYIAEISESNFSPAQISSNSLDTSSHSNILAGLNALTPPRLYANTHKSFVDQIETWNTNASKASVALTKTEAEIFKLANEIELNTNNVVTCETASALSAAYAEQQYSSLENFINSPSGEDTILLCYSLYIAEQKIWEAFDRYNELKTDRKAVVDDLVSTQ